MSKLIDIFNTFSTTSKILIIVLILLVILLVVFSIIFALRNDTDEVEDTNLDFFDELKKEDDNSKSVFVPNDTNIENIEQEKKQEETKNNKIDLQSISNQIEKDIEKNNIELTEFEMEQEEKAIISYDELIRKVKQNDLDNVNIQTVDLDDRGYELEPEFSYDTEVLDFSDILEPSDNSKFKASPVISPVEGIQSPSTEMIKRTDIKSILDLDEVDEKTYSNTEFLSALKDLRDSLQ